MTLTRDEQPYTIEGGYAVYRAGNPQAACRLICAHGWGQDHRAFLALSQSFGTRAEVLLLDLPGFGCAELPPPDWGTADYADAIAGFIQALPKKPTIWIGHSYGCRVGMQLAARHSGCVDGLLLVAAPGLPRRRSLLQSIQRSAKIVTFKALKLFATSPEALDRLRQKFGSADYRTAGALRPILVRAVNEDLSAEAAAIQCPVNFVYGANDQDTPPEIGARLKVLIAGAKLTILPGFDHHTILSDGRHQVAKLLNQMLDEKKST